METVKGGSEWLSCEMGGGPAGCLIATKADRDSQTNDFSPGQIRKSVMESLERLGMNHLPLVYLHDPEHHPLYQSDRAQAMGELFGPDGAVHELEKMRDEGILSYIGISGGPIDLLLECISMGRFDAVITHNRWNLLNQTAEPLLEKATSLKMGIVNAGVYASGILATGPNETARAVYRVANEVMKERVRRMEAICLEYEVPLAAAALQFSLRDSRITSTAVGLSAPEQVEETLRLATLRIPDQLWGDLKPLADTLEDPEKGRWIHSHSMVAGCLPVMS